MNIKGLDIREISERIEPYIADYFKNYQLLDSENGIFSENHEFEFSEIKHLIPAVHHSLYKDNDKFQGACGLVTFEMKEDDPINMLTYTTMLILDEQYENALFLLIQVESKITSDIRDILIADFLI